MPPEFGAGNPWDVSTNFVPVCANYGLTVPMWFCPVRADETAAAYAAAKIKLGRDMSTVADLNAFLNGVYGFGLTIMNHNLWVKKTSSSGIVSPAPGAVLPNTDLATYGWPVKTTSPGSGHVPFMSDACFSGYGTSGTTSVSDINIIGANNLIVAGIKLKKTSGHVSNGQIQSVNMVFADGHVATHNKQQIQAPWSDPSQPVSFFY
jgi:prepilin-type processing-associated H-X9-DG protein